MSGAKEDIPAGSVLGRFSTSLAEAVEGHNNKVMPVGVIPGIHCEYLALDDDQAKEIRDAANLRAKQLARTTRNGGGEDSEGQRQAYAQLLARACVQLVVPTTDPENPYEPLHVAINREEGTEFPPLRYNQDLVKALAAVGDIPGGLDEESTAVEIVTTLHRQGKSTAPLLTMGSLYDAWRSGVTSAVIADTIGE